MARRRLWGWDRPDPRTCRVSARFPPTNKETSSRSSGSNPNPHPDGSGNVDNTPLTHTRTTPPNPTGMQQGPCREAMPGGGREGGHLPHGPAGHPLPGQSPRGRRVGTAGLEDGVGMLLLLWWREGCGLLFLLFLTCSPLLPPALLLLFLSGFLSLPPSLSLSGLLPLVLTATFAQFT